MITPKKRQFAKEYLIDLNASQAYTRTGYRGKNRSARASELKAKPEVSARIEELIAERSARTGINQDRVIRELARIGFIDPTKLMDMGTAAILDSATEDDLAAIGRNTRLRFGPIVVDARAHPRDDGNVVEP